MKDQRGSIAVILLAILALLAIGGGAYYEVQQKAASQNSSALERQLAKTSDVSPTGAANNSQTTTANVKTQSYFKASVTAGEAPLTVNFTANRGDPIFPPYGCEGMESQIAFPTDFGDGNVGTIDMCADAHVAHTYNKSGIYKVIIKSVCERGDDTPECMPTVATFTISVAAGNSSAASVPGMSKYTDPDFGFSFWYPSGWTVSERAAADPNKFSGGVIKKEFAVGLSDAPPTGSGVVVSEYASPLKTITDPGWCGAMGACGSAIRYYFEVGAHTWMMQYPTGASGEGGSIAPMATKAADVSQNTMGGLHMLSGSRNDTIIPLSAQNFLVVSSARSESVSRPGEQDGLAKTIVATDPLVATPVSAAEQIKAIQAEKDAYASTDGTQSTLASDVIKTSTTTTLVLNQAKEFQIMPCGSSSGWLESAFFELTSIGTSTATLNIDRIPVTAHVQENTFALSSFIEFNIQEIRSDSATISITPQVRPFGCD